MSKLQANVAGAAVFVVFSVVLMAIWGSRMDFPVDLGKDISQWINDRIRWTTGS